MTTRKLNYKKTIPTYLINFTAHVAYLCAVSKYARLLLNTVNLLKISQSVPGDHV